MAREAALKTKGSGGPSGVDDNGFRSMLARKSLKKASAGLCCAIAGLGIRLCTEFIDFLTIEPILVNRVIPLDKGNGDVRPMIRRIIGNCVTKVTKEDIADACGSLQVCARLTSGGEAAIHAMHSILKADDTDAVLLTDASNAFNSLNRAAVLYNSRILCSSISTYAMNTYREPARLIDIGE